MSSVDRTASGREAKGSGSLKATLKIDGAREVLAMFNGLPKETSEALRVESGLIGNWLAGKVKQAAPHSYNHQAVLIAKTVKVSKDRVPVLSVGGGLKVAKGSKRARSQSASAIVFATEFGLNPHHNGPHGFQVHRGAQSYFFLDVIDANATEVAKMWKDAVGKVLLAANNATPGVE